MTSTRQTSPACVGINNYFKVYRNQIFPFNDQSDLSLSRALNLASVLSRGGKIVVWKRFLGMPEFLQVVGEVPDYIPTTGRKRRHEIVRPSPPAEPSSTDAPTNGAGKAFSNGALG